MRSVPRVRAVVEVARFYASRDFAVPSQSAMEISISAREASVPYMLSSATNVPHSPMLG